MLQLSDGACEPDEACRELVCAHQCRDVRSQAELLDALRRDREVHQYKTIWTKDAHGGPYRKASVARHC